MRELLSQFIRLYQLSVSPLLGNRCRFYPSCSQYARECLEKYELPRAVGKIGWRVLRCQPLNAGGVDLP